jgi:hypothetical protein
MKMKRCVLFAGIVLAVCVMLTSYDVVEELLSLLFGESGGQSSLYNPLRNTTWQSEDLTGGIGAFVGVYVSERVDFGDTSFKMRMQSISNGMDMGSESKTGTYEVSGETVTLTASDGTQWTGTLIGNSLTLDDVEYTRIQ